MTRSDEQIIATAPGEWEVFGGFLLAFGAGSLAFALVGAMMAG